MEQNPADESPDSAGAPKTSEPQFLDKRYLTAIAEQLASSGILVSAESFSGPLPSPKALEEYKRVAPELLDAIVKEYREEGPHRRKNEEMLIKNGILLSRLGIFFAVLITFFFLSAGVYVILQGYNVAGTTICGVGMGSVVMAFLRHTSPQPARKRTRL